MNTLYLGTSDSDIKTAASLLRDSRLVVFPTETVYGLGALADDAAAVASVYSAKGRPADNPLIVHVDGLAMAQDYAENLSPAEKEFFREFSPGPFTLIVQRKPHRARAACAGQDTIGLRIPKEEVALRLIRETGGGIAAPSANMSGRPSPTDFFMARADMDGRVAAIIKGPESEKGLESTILRITSRALYILRPGSVTADHIIDVAETVLPGLPVLYGGEVPASPALQNAGLSTEGVGTEYQQGDESHPVAPGTKYRHYSPSARVFLYDSASRLFQVMNDSLVQLSCGQTGDCRLEVISLAEDEARVRSELARFTAVDAAAGPSGSAVCVEVCVVTDLDEYAHKLYRLFVQADEKGVQALYCRMPEDSAAGKALCDRLSRAAAG